MDIARLPADSRSSEKRVIMLALALRPEIAQFAYMVFFGTLFLGAVAVAVFRGAGGGVFKTAAASFAGYLQKFANRPVFPDNRQPAVSKLLWLQRVLEVCPNITIAQLKQAVDMKFTPAQAKNTFNDQDGSAAEEA